MTLCERAWRSVAARALEQRLSSARGAREIGLGAPIRDRYVCSLDTGAPISGERHWTYECSDATNSQRSGFFVLTRGDTIAAIEPSG